MVSSHARFECRRSSERRKLCNGKGVRKMNFEFIDSPNADYSRTIEFISFSSSTSESSGVVDSSKNCLLVFRTEWSSLFPLNLVMLLRP